MAMKHTFVFKVLDLKNFFADIKNNKKLEANTT